MRVTFLSGAGGGGKTSVIQKMREVVNETIGVQESITREFYAKKGVANQAGLLANVGGALQFQVELAAYYREHTKKFLLEAGRTYSDIYIDRSPIDHLAYLVLSSPDLTLAIFREEQKKAIGFFRDLDYVFEDLETRVAYFPYPLPWSLDVDPDPFRAASPQNNVKHDAMVEKFARVFGESLGYEIVFMGETMTVDQRVNQLLD